MSPEAQRIALADFEGIRFRYWRRLVHGSAYGRYLSKADAENAQTAFSCIGVDFYEDLSLVPDYPNDLNAIYRVEQQISTTMAVPGDPSTIPMARYTHMLFDWCNERGVWASSISAQVRAEMLVRLIGKWES